MSRHPSWTAAYRLALHLLPAGLRRKHGPAMEDLFARDLGQARAQGRLHGALAGAAGVWDVVQRSAYERVRPAHHAARDAHGSTLTPAPRWAGTTLGEPHMPQPTTAQLLRRHAVSFAIAFAALTVALLAQYAFRQLPMLAARGEPAGTIAQALLLAVPFTMAMTLPMAVLVAVLREFTRLGADGTLASARRERGGIRRLVVPVLAAAAGVAGLAFVVTAEIVPRANLQLGTVIAGGASPVASDREMTIGELRSAARTGSPHGGPVAPARAAAYEVEVQKKLALPAACVVLALVGIAAALRAPRGGAWLVIGVSCTVFGAYYMLLVTGESLADRLVVSPAVGMWGANALLLAVALLAVWSRRSPRAPSGSGTVMIRG